MTVCSRSWVQSALFSLGFTIIEDTPEQGFRLGGILQALAGIALNIVVLKSGGSGSQTDCRGPFTW